ncbi:hypothetical protein LCGC14_2796890, partial [marine sediment metagenome]
MSFHLLSLWGLTVPAGNGGGPVWVVLLASLSVKGGDYQIDGT